MRGAMGLRLGEISFALGGKSNTLLPIWINGQLGQLKGRWDINQLQWVIANGILYGLQSQMPE
jgi:hypothetical protein